MIVKTYDVWGDFSKIISDLENSSQIDLIILDFLHETSTTLWTAELTKKFIYVTRNTPIILATPNLSTNIVDDTLIKQDNVEIVRWETFFFKKTYSVWSSPCNVEYNLQKNIDIRDNNVCHEFELSIPYICLNNYVKPHRCLILDLLAKHKLIEKGAISWLNKFYWGVIQTDYQYNHWSPTILSLDQSPNVKFNQETLPIQFNSSFMQLVTETSNDITFFTEKTATPILLNKLFLVASCQGFHKKLENLGFILYDELFDYSFDDESDIEIRYTKLVQNIERYSELSSDRLTTLYKSVLNKVKHNRQMAMHYVNSVPNRIKELHDIVRKNDPKYIGALNTLIN
jgi:hypothetical protein